ncbi:MAG: hypothetical protein VKI42_04500, partial [Synechococcaceae cyanobacterium]|nr:hypothetical protein [Synechococcaceae cyanobacterium]
ERSSPNLRPKQAAQGNRLRICPFEALQERDGGSAGLWIPDRDRGRRRCRAAADAHLFAG